MPANEARVGKTREQALALARSILAGKHTVGCPIPFSYVGAGIWLSEYVLEEEALGWTSVPHEESCVDAKNSTHDDSCGTAKGGC